MLSSIWKQFLSIVQQEVGSQVVETWLKAVSLHQWDSLKKTVYLIAPNQFVKDWIKNNYYHLFEVHFGRLLNVDTPKIVFLHKTEHVKDKASDTINIIPAKPLQTHKKTALQRYKPPRKLNLNKNYSFDTFVKGPNNQMAYAAALAVTKNLGLLYNPLFIYGGSGLGKTHLLHAIAHEIIDKYPDVEIVYQSAERFVQEFIHAIRFDKIHRFQAKYKSIDVFLVDDIQFISNKEQTQEAFFHIFNAMYDAHKQIVFSSDSYPANINGLAERLRSRLAWGLVADVQSPALETKIAIVRQKADLYKQNLSDNVVSVIAQYATSNVRQLEGALIRVIASAEIYKKTITVEFVHAVLKQSVASENHSQVIELEHIVQEIKEVYSYGLYDLRSEKRSKHLSQARHIAMFIMKMHTKKSLQEIAVYLGRKDHSTVIHGCKKVEQLLKQDQDIQRIVQTIEQRIQHVHPA